MFKRTQTNELENFRKQILSLYNEGVNASTIGHYLNRDHTTILYHLRALGVKRERQPKPLMPRVILRKPVGKFGSTIKGPDTPYIENGVKFCEGKTYAEYIQEERDKKWRQLLRQ